MLRTEIRRIRNLSLVLASAVLFMCLAGGCSDDDPLSPQAVHFDAIGMLIYQSGAVVLDYFGPDYTASDQVADLDSITISQGLNPHYNAKFYDEDGNIVDPPDDADKYLSAVFDDTSVAELWWHEGEEGEYEFHIRGKKAGQTTVTFQVYHIDHPDFATLPIPLTVDDQVLHDAPIGVKLIDEESGDSLATSYLADSSQSVQGSVSISSGTTSDHIEAIFFDYSGTEFWPPVPPHSLVVESADTSIVAVTGQEQDEPWAFKLQGKNPGTTTITVYIYHDDHIGKTFKPITVSVN